MKYLTHQEQKILVKTVSELKGKKAERDSCIIELILETGLRAAEVIGLNVGDVRNRNKLYVRPEIAKRSKAAFVPLNKEAQGVIKRHMRQKVEWKESIRDESPLFVSRNGDRLSKRSLQEAIEGWMIRAGLVTSKAGKTVALYSVHSLRHSYAKRKIEGGCKLESLQHLMRHTSLASTGVYIEPTWDELVEAAAI